ncbi:DUF1876 domain-containing protein [Streptomyces lushanensis]|uniref:DUF1876 domain-containing protein n=1 Tax=Streptomyces lushanensis TaxID=1434255 RepID=UPI00082B4D4A|nr:DUF1876 domain-containing protein [Streptomyces lushanensis]
MSKTAEWTARLYLFEEDGRTTARVVLDTGTTSLAGHGRARCSPDDVDVPEIGDELAAGRALTDLGGLLIQVANRDMEGVGAARSVRTGWTDRL